jgi:hypothetical protein
VLETVLTAVLVLAAVGLTWVVVGTVRRLLRVQP